MSLHTRHRRARTAVVGAVAAALLAGCSGSGGSSSGSDTLVVFTGQAGDYQLNYNPYSPTMIDGPGTIFEGLFFYNLTKRAEPEPLLGTAYAWNEDGTELSVTLREGVKWSDGEAFTADDVVFTLDMITKYPTMNGTGYRGKATAVDDTHVRISFDKPAFMEGPQILGKIWMVPEHIWGKFEDPSKDRVRNPVGTGPYLVDDFKAQAFTLKANPAYWGGEPKVKKVRYLSLSGNQAGADALAAGKIDWQTGPVPDLANVEKNYPGYRSVTVPMNQTALFTCSDSALGCKGPQTDPAVRKAIYHALDRRQINSLAFQNTSSEISPGFALPGRDDGIISGKLRNALAPMDPDLPASAELLRAAGWRKGPDGIHAKGGRKLELTVKVVSGWTDYITAVDTMTQQLRKAGIKLTAQQLSWNEWSDARGQGEYELIIDALTPGPAPDPYYLYSSATTAPVGEAANPNFSRFRDAAVDEALERLKAMKPDDTAARQEQYDVIQTRLEEVMPYIPVLTGGTTSEYHADKFTGWPTREDTYAFPAIWSRPDHAQVFKNLKPAG
jgi:peptide/nickel transport system substrate-binding protein